MQPLEKRLSEFLKQRSLKKTEKIAKGWSSEIYLVQNSKDEKFALKIEREKSPRKEMVEREAENLKTANSAGVGPKLIAADVKNRIILMQYIDGVTFQKWLFEKNPTADEMKTFLKLLFEQAKKLDELGLDHGQLGGNGRNILVWDKCPVIVDFEKASANRKVHNTAVLESFLYKNPKSAFVKKVKEILEE